MLFYDWEYHDGIDIKGATKLKYYFEKSERRLVSAESTHCNVW